MKCPKCSSQYIPPLPCFSVSLLQQGWYQMSRHFSALLLCLVCRWGSSCLVLANQHQFVVGLCSKDGISCAAVSFALLLCLVCRWHSSCLSLYAICNLKKDCPKILIHLVCVLATKTFSLSKSDNHIILLTISYIKGRKEVGVLGPVNHCG